MRDRVYQLSGRLEFMIEGSAESLNALHRKVDKLAGRTNEDVG